MYCPRKIRERQSRCENGSLALGSWRTFLFSITAELSIVMYLIVWRWKLDSWEWGLNGPLEPYWSFWTIMTVITTPWVFGIPLIGPLLLKWKNSRRFENSLWL